MHETRDNLTHIWVEDNFVLVDDKFAPQLWEFNSSAKAKRIFKHIEKQKNIGSKSLYEVANLICRKYYDDFDTVYIKEGTNL